MAVASLLRQLGNVITELKSVHQQIQEIYTNHQNMELIDSMPGIGDILDPVFAGEIGADISRFWSLGMPKAFAGCDPVTSQSGESHEVAFRRACNLHLRRDLHLVSQGAIVRAGWSRELYDRQRAHGKPYGRALRAVGEQLIEILYILLKKRIACDEDYHLQMKAKHGKRAQNLT